MPWYDRVVLWFDRWIHISLRLMEHPVDTIAGKAGTLRRTQRLLLSLAFGVGGGLYALLRFTQPGEVLEGLTWGSYFGAVLVFGCTFGMTVLWLSRWWFEVRLWLSNVAPIPAGTAFDTHLLPTVFWTGPALVGGLLMSLYFRTPGSVGMSSQGWAPAALLGLLGLWSEIAFLLTVRRVFRLSLLKLALGFVLLPGVVLWGIRSLAAVLKKAAT